MRPLPRRSKARSKASFVLFPFRNSEFTKIDAARLVSELASASTPLKPAVLNTSLSIATLTGLMYSCDELEDISSSFVGAGVRTLNGSARETSCYQ